jgi:cytoskeletal protein CcmA (bactofilin family)
MNGKEFWLRWRGEILRGTMIFLVVVGGGFFVRSVVGRGREKLEGLRDQFNTDFLAADRQRAEPWHYTADLAPQRTLWLRNINGSIAVDSAEGNKLEITAERTFKHSSVDSVQILTSTSEHGLTVCAMWPGRAVQCGPDGHYSTDGGVHGNDVALVFTVRLPAGVKLDASTVNGDVEVNGATAPVDAGTVNGDIAIETAHGPVRAATVNGDVAAVLHGFSGPGDVNVATVHGDASLTLPDKLDAVVEGHTVAGDINTDYPLVVSGKFASHTIGGTLGKGGRRLNLNTVTGDVELRRLSATTTPLPERPAITPRPPRRPRPR